MNVWTAVALMIVILFCAHTCTGLYQRWRCRASTRLDQDEQLILQRDRVSMHVQIDSNISSSLRAGLSFRGEGRLVLSDSRLILGSTKGRLLELSMLTPGTIRAIGPRRLLLKGFHPSKKGMVRAELVIDDEAHWAEKSNLFSSV